MAGNPRGGSLASWLCRDPDDPGLSVSMRRTIRYFRKMHQATPAWANMKKINAYYKLAKKLGKEVDHIVPLCSNYVCGLHCEANLQMLTPEQNNHKSNNNWPDSPFDNHQLFNDPDEPEQYELLV